MKMYAIFMLNLGVLSLFSTLPTSTDAHPPDHTPTCGNIERVLTKIWATDGADNYRHPLPELIGAQCETRIHTATSDVYVYDYICWLPIQPQQRFPYPQCSQTHHMRQHAQKLRRYLIQVATYGTP